jgi:hypothetical protein
MGNFGPVFKWARNKQCSPRLPRVSVTTGRTGHDLSVCPLDHSMVQASKLQKGYLYILDKTVTDTPCKRPELAPK